MCSGAFLCSFCQKVIRILIAMCAFYPIFFISVFPCYIVMYKKLTMILCLVGFPSYQDNPSEKEINQGTLVVFNLDSSVSNDKLHHIFGVYGEIKEVSLFQF